MPRLPSVVPPPSARRTSRWNDRSAWHALQSLSGFVEQLREAAKQEDDRRAKAKAKAWAARKKEREDNLFVAATHEVGTWFGADDDPKPPEPEPEPHRQADTVTVRGRTIPAGGGGGGGGTSSAVPADLRSFQSGIRSCDESLAGAVSTFRNALTDYESGCNPCWGTLSAQSLVTAVNDWMTANGQDAVWAVTVAAQFEAAGGGTGPATLLDASISAALAAAGIGTAPGSRASRNSLRLGAMAGSSTTSLTSRLTQISSGCRRVRPGRPSSRMACESASRFE
ncbi:hypothetical protein DEJ15_10135 [Curtobacterium sp. MCJR17_043]|nr:hypothetical protein [Curtobacterium sp. MCJR17_043]WIB34899.1 hypothetical protein DEJ15_10135 [Curtobacterium sp. MCJR17_043]